VRVSYSTSRQINRETNEKIKESPRNMLRLMFSRISSPFRRKVRLRHVLHLGSLMERQVEAFYRSFAREAQDAEVKELCIKLADEETRHFRMIGAVLSKWTPKPPNRKDLEAIDVDGKLRTLFLSPPSSDVTKTEIVEYAMNIERKMVEFYRSFADKFTSEWKIKKLQLMEAEKIQHFMKLKNMLAGLTVKRQQNATTYLDTRVSHSVYH